MSTPPHAPVPWETGTTSTRDYLYMTALERIFDEPMVLLQSFQIPYHRRRYLLKQWRNDRSRYLAENCRDMDYINDPEMDGLLHALNALKQQPRRYA